MTSYMIESWRIGLQVEDHNAFDSSYDACSLCHIFTVSKEGIRATLFNFVIDKSCTKTAGES